MRASIKDHIFPQTSLLRLQGKEELNLALVEHVLEAQVEVRLTIVGQAADRVSGSHAISTLHAYGHRQGMAGVGYLIVACAINHTLLLLRLVTAILGGYHSDGLVLAYSRIDLLTAPLVPISIAINDDFICRELDAARSESTARVAFLAQMSHELRTLLDTILGNAQLLSRPNGKAMAPEGVELIQDSGWRLLRMVDDILGHACGRAGQLGIAPSSLDWPGFSPRGEIDAARVAGRNANCFVLRCKGPLLRRVRFDEARLRQVLDNLIAKAPSKRSDALSTASVSKQNVSPPSLTFMRIPVGDGHHGQT